MCVGLVDVGLTQTYYRLFRGNKKSYCCNEQAGCASSHLYYCVGSGDSRGHGGFFYDNIFLPLLLSGGYADKTRQEAVIKQSNLDWVIVRPGALSNGAAKGQYRVMLDGNYEIKGIARADVAAFVLEQLTSDTYLKKTPNISY